MAHPFSYTVNIVIYNRAVITSIVSKYIKSCYKGKTPSESIISFYHSYKAGRFNRGQLEVGLPDLEAVARVAEYTIGYAPIRVGTNRSKTNRSFAPVWSKMSTF